MYRKAVLYSGMRHVDGQHDPLTELGLAAGAVREHFRRTLADGTRRLLLTCCLYWLLVPIKGHGLHRLLSMLILVLGIAVAQPIARQDLATLKIANELYAKSFKALREAKTVAAISDTVNWNRY